MIFKTVCFAGRWGRTPTQGVRNTGGRLLGLGDRCGAQVVAGGAAGGAVGRMDPRQIDGKSRSSRCTADHMDPQSEL